MPQVVAQAWVPVAPSTAFAVSQTTGATRLRWDPFIRPQHFVDAEHAAKDVRTFTRARLGLAMTSRYVSYRPPTSVGMTMERGPWFFATFGGGWRFEAAPPGPETPQPHTCGPAAQVGTCAADRGVCGCGVRAEGPGVSGDRC